MFENEFIVYDIRTETVKSLKAMYVMENGYSFLFIAREVA